MKPWYQSVTVWFNVLTFIAAIAAIADQLPIGAAAVKWLVAVGAIANIAIRVFLTKTAVTATTGGNQ